MIQSENIQDHTIKKHEKDTFHTFGEVLKAIDSN